MVRMNGKQREKLFNLAIFKIVLWRRCKRFRKREQTQTNNNYRGGNPRLIGEPENDIVLAHPLHLPQPTLLYNIVLAKLRLPSSVHAW